MNPNSNDINKDNEKNKYTPKQLRLLIITLGVLAIINIIFSIMIIRLGQKQMGLTFIGTIVIFTITVFFNLIKNKKK